MFLFKHGGWAPIFCETLYGDHYLVRVCETTCHLSTNQSIDEFSPHLGAYRQGLTFPAFYLPPGFDLNQFFLMVSSMLVTLPWAEFHCNVSFGTTGFKTIRGIDATFAYSALLRDTTFDEAVHFLNIYLVSLQRADSARAHRFAPSPSKSFPTGTESF